MGDFCIPSQKRHDPRVGEVSEAKHGTFVELLKVQETGELSDQELHEKENDLIIKGILAAPPQSYPHSNKGLIAGLIKENQWLINP